MNSGNVSQDTEQMFLEIEQSLHRFETLLNMMEEIDSTMFKEMNTFNDNNGLETSKSAIVHEIIRRRIDLQDQGNRIELLKEKIERKTIKILIFGRVSVGKSKVLNVILSNDLFRSATSHTTSCFVKINKSTTSAHSISYGNKTESFSTFEGLKKKVEKLSTDLGDNKSSKLDLNKSLDIYLRMDDNKLLRPNTQIVDSPGSSNKEEITRCIEKESLDADIFIFIMSNSLTHQDTDFFKYHSKLSSKPDIFILINGWDHSDSDEVEATEKSRRSIMEDLLKFLTTEGGVTKQEAEKRIFFVSAKEMFESRIKEKTKKAKRNQISEKQRKRQEEFEKFEDSLSNYIDHPEINKRHRHIPEIEGILTYLTKEKKHFSDYVNNLKNIETKQNLESAQSKLSALYNTILADIRMKNQKVITDINNEFRRFTNQLSEDNIPEIESEINLLMSTIASGISTIQTETNDDVKKMKTTYNDHIGKCAFKEKIEKPKLKDALKQKISLQRPPEKGWFEWFWSFVKTSEHEIVKDDRKQIKDRNAETINNINDFINRLESYVTNEHQRFQAVLQYKLNYFNSYWSRIEKCISEY